MHGMAGTIMIMYGMAGTIMHDCVCVCVCLSYVPFLSI